MKTIDKLIAKYPETGLIDPFFGTNINLTTEMRDFFNSYILYFHDYPDSCIAREFAEKFGISYEIAKQIEYDYVVVNRARIYKYIENRLIMDLPSEEIIELLGTDFGIDHNNADSYVHRCGMDRMESDGLFLCEPTLAKEEKQRDAEEFRKMMLQRRESRSAGDREK